MSDPQDVAESLDEEELSDVDDDPAGDLQYPPDHLEGVNQYGVTAAEEHTDEPLEERISREVPEADDAEAQDAEVGRLIEDGDDLDAIDAPQRDLSAEESAVHLVDPDRP